MIKQLTFAPRHHQLTNIRCWTADSQWLVFDTRPSGASFTGETIERVNIRTGQVEVVYHADRGAHVGVVTAHPHSADRYVFIHGPENPDAQWHYDFHHRRGVIVDEQRQATTLDALDITPPYTPGALRGGSHVHVWSPDGSRLSFTYNDHVMHERGERYDQRNVGIALPVGPVVPALLHPREYQGSHFCVLVSNTTLDPLPGSDQISRAYEEGWVGDAGYINRDGVLQRWALAFIGDTWSLSGQRVPELFIVDLPDELSAYQRPGACPLAGTEYRLPAPPEGVMQRRLTFTHQRAYPGVVNTPRHWVRSHPDGSCLAFLMADDKGTVQLWTQALTGGEPRQITYEEQSIASAFNWHPSGDYVAFVLQGRIVLCDMNSGAVMALTPEQANQPSPDAVVFSPDGAYVAWMQVVEGYQQLFIADVVIDGM